MTTQGQCLLSVQVDLFTYSQGHDASGPMLLSVHVDTVLMHTQGHANLGPRLTQCPF